MPRTGADAGGRGLPLRQRHQRPIGSTRTRLKTLIAEAPCDGAARPVLPYGRHAIDEDDIAAVVAVLRGDWLTTGPAVRAFEDGAGRSVAAPLTR